MCEMKLLIHSQTSTVVPLTFWFTVCVITYPCCDAPGNFRMANCISLDQEVIAEADHAFKKIVMPESIWAPSQNKVFSSIRIPILKMGRS